jgi:mevalonate kinase
MSIVAVAPGKIILAGEHAVVYGKRALATSIDMCTFVELAPAQPSAGAPHVQLSILYPGSTAEYTWSASDVAGALHLLNDAGIALSQELDTFPPEAVPILQALPHASSQPCLVFLMYYMVFCGQQGLTTGGAGYGTRCRVASQLPIGAGLGSSASYCAGLVTAFHAFASRQANDGGCTGGKGSGEMEKEKKIEGPGCCKPEGKGEEAGGGAQVGEGEGEGLQGQAHTLAEDKKISTAMTETTTKEMTTTTMTTTTKTKTKSGTDLPLSIELRSFLNRWAFEGEKVIHGAPSGVDNTVSIYGGMLIYRKQHPYEFVDRLPDVQILIANTKVPKDTKALVDKVRRLKDASAATFERAMGGIEAISEAIIRDVAAVQAGTCSEEQFLAGLGAAFRANYRHLVDLGVGHAKIEQVVALADALGIPAKITGAGGGGCVIALLAPGLGERAVQGFERGLREAGCDVYRARLGQGGARLHRGVCIEDLMTR